MTKCSMDDCTHSGYSLISNNIHILLMLITKRQREKLADRAEKQNETLRLVDLFAKRATVLDIPTSSTFAAITDNTSLCDLLVEVSKS